jgi:uncharacterized repeat protein (TIGR03803 family)
MSIESAETGVSSRQSARALRICLLGLVWLAALSGTASAQTNVKVLHTFCSLAKCADGGSPSGLIRDAEGNLYGSTSLGGTHAKGVLYKLAPSGAVTVLYNFCSLTNCADGWATSVSLLDPEGNLYGIGELGGAQNKGVVYKLAASGTYTVLHSFCSLANCADGWEPSTDSLIGDPEGNLYGVTPFGGSSSNTSNGAGSGGGVVFKVAPSGNETVLYNFCSLENCIDGKNPEGPLLLDTEGDLIGTTFAGGANNAGVIYKVDPSGNETVLYNFCSLKNCADGSFPMSGVISDAAGDLIGTTFAGGANQSAGTVFKLNPSGTETVLYNFCSLANCTDGSKPYTGVISDGVGNFYGSIAYTGIDQSGNGLLYELSASGTETVLCNFDTNCSALGAQPGGLVIDPEGNLYATTSNGGYDGGPPNGLLFELVN